MTGPARGSLAWKLYFLGIVQLVILGAAVLGVGNIIGPLRHPGPSLDVERAAKDLAARAEDGAALTERLVELRERRALELTLYDADRNVVASNVTPPLAIPEGSGEAGERPRVGSAPIDVHGARGRLVGGRIHAERPGPLAPLLTFSISGLLIVGVGAFLTARWIVRPLQQLSGAARALGAGDLRARTGFERADELGEVGRAFDEMAERIQQLVLAEKELLANVSHELRTPLARIRVALDIAGEADAETGRMSMTEIGVDITELEAIIDDIVTSTRLEIARGGAPMAGFALHMEEIGPESICERAQERFRARHVLRPLSVEVEEKLPIVRADPVLLRRVVDNLLENAHKYSPDPTTAVSLRLRRAPGGVMFEISDRGMGISPEDLPHVFAPFFRAERSRTRGLGGVGLGLTLARRIVDAHRGSIDVQSAVGEGTTMRVFVPEDTPAPSA